MTKDEALKLALDALEGFIPYLPLKDETQCNRYDKAITAIEATLEAKDDPVALQYPQKDIDWQREQQIKAQGSTTPQRTWVGLTEEDLKPICDEWRIVYGAWMDDFARDIEAKLKEKNT